MGNTGGGGDFSSREKLFRLEKERGKTLQCTCHQQILTLANPLFKVAHCMYRTNMNAKRKAGCQKTLTQESAVPACHNFWEFVLFLVKALPSSWMPEIYRRHVHLKAYTSPNSRPVTILKLLNIPTPILGYVTGISGFKKTCSLWISQLIFG